MIEKFKSFISKFLIRQLGVTLVKQQASLFIVKGTNLQLPFYNSVKTFLRKHHNFHKDENVEIFIKPDFSLKNKILFKDHGKDGIFYSRNSTYIYIGTGWEIELCTKYLEKIFGEIPEKISYKINVIKK